MDDVKFVDGLYFKEPREQAPDFVKGSLSMHREKLIGWLEENQANESGYINLNIKISRGGKPYIAVDNWVPDKDKAPSQPAPQGQAQGAQSEMDKPIPMDDSSVPF